MTKSVIRRYAFAAAASFLAVNLLQRLQPHVNVATAGLVLITVVTIAAVVGGSGPGLLSALITIVGLNYFFIPPVHTFTIAGTENLIAFFVFMSCAVLVGTLSARAQDRARRLEEESARAATLQAKLRVAQEEANEAELLRRSESLKSALLDAVTHDVRTPLTSIKASVTALLADGARLAKNDPESTQEFLQVIDEESDRLDHFIENMVELAALQSNQIAIRRESASVQEMIEAAIARVGRSADERTMEIAVSNNAAHVNADPRLIAEVIYNLLDNALKYSPRQGRITIRATRADAESVLLSVDDEGPGIPKPLRQEVFRKFFRLPDAANPVHGFGMGLAIARGIVEAHGGKIWADEGPSGSGSSIAFTVPSESA